MSKPSTPNAPDRNPSPDKAPAHPSTPTPKPPSVPNGADPAMHPSVKNPSGKRPR
jgi:hypothetical protein